MTRRPPAEQAREEAKILKAEKKAEGYRRATEFHEEAAKEVEQMRQAHQDKEGKMRATMTEHPGHVAPPLPPRRGDPGTPPIPPPDGLSGLSDFIREGRSIKVLAAELGELVADKQEQYGNSVGRCWRLFEELYPNGIRSDQYGDVLMMARVIDKLSRIAQRGPDSRDRGGESPWQDIAGYGLLGWRKDKEQAESEAIF